MCLAPKLLLPSTMRLAPTSLAPKALLLLCVWRHASGTNGSYQHLGERLRSLAPSASLTSTAPALRSQAPHACYSHSLWHLCIWHRLFAIRPVSGTVCLPTARSLTPPVCRPRSLAPTHGLASAHGLWHCLLATRIVSGTKTTTTVVCLAPCFWHPWLIPTPSVNVLGLWHQNYYYCCVSGTMRLAPVARWIA
jgi:hypothetical protein